MTRNSEPLIRQTQQLHKTRSKLCSTLRYVRFEHQHNIRFIHNQIKSILHSTCSTPPSLIMAISELLRFTLPRSFAGTKTFHAIRSHFAQYGAAKQYFGYVLPDQGVPLPQPKDQMCWFIGERHFLKMACNTIRIFSRMV